MLQLGNETKGCVYLLTARVWAREAVRRTERARKDMIDVFVVVVVVVVLSSCDAWARLEREVWRQLQR